MATAPASTTLVTLTEYSVAAYPAPWTRKKRPEAMSTVQEAGVRPTTVAQPWHSRRVISGDLSRD